MATTTGRVFDEALSLPANERLLLVTQLLTSLNLPIQPEIDREWAAEAERRVSEIDNGDVVLIPGEDVFSAIRTKYRK